MKNENIQYKCDLLLLPSNVKELKFFLKNNKKEADCLIISSKLSLTSYCLKKDLRFIQYKDLINQKRYEQIDVTSFMKEFRVKNPNLFLNDLHSKYFFYLQSQFSDFFKIISFSKLLGDGISKNICFKKMHLFNCDYSTPLPRKNLENFNKLLLSIKFKNDLYQPFYKEGLNSKLNNFFNSFLNRHSRKIIFLEYCFYKARYFNFTKNIRIKENKDSIIFFSDGRDFVFHSKLSFYLKNAYCFKGSSIFNTDTKNNFTSISHLKYYLLNGFFKTNLKCKSNIDNIFLKTLLEEYGVSLEYLNKFGESHLNYIEFIIKRDFSFIKSLSFIISKIKPKLSFSSSLTLTSLAAFDQGIKSISEFEGFGIDHNPSSCSLSGDYILAPTKFSNEMFKKHNMGDGLLLNNGAYYLDMRENL